MNFFFINAHILAAVTSLTIHYLLVGPMYLNTHACNFKNLSRQEIIFFPPAQLVFIIELS